MQKILIFLTSNFMNSRSLCQLKFALVFRKHRKGLVRRIRPVEETIPDESISADPIVYVPADEDTVYVQNTENIEERISEDVPAEIQDKNNAEVLPPRTAPSKYGVSLYNYSKAKPKHINDERNDTNESKFSNKDLDSRLHLHPRQQEYSRASYPMKYYHEAPQQHHYSVDSSHNNTRYHTGHYESFSPRYKKTKYFDDQPPPVSFYPPHSSSLRNSKTPMYSRNLDKFKTDTYVHHDKYRTMVGLPADNQKQPKSFNLKTKNTENGTGYNLEKGPVDKENYENSNKNNTNKNNLNSSSELPPQLVHVSETATSSISSKHEESENTSAFNKSPPALEKRESSFAEDDSIKVENEMSQEIVNGAGGAVKYNSNQFLDQDAEQSPSTSKFVYVTFLKFYNSMKKFKMFHFYKIYRYLFRVFPILEF